VYDRRYSGHGRNLIKAYCPTIADHKARFPGLPQNTTSTLPFSERPILDDTMTLSEDLLNFWTASVYLELKDSGRSPSIFDIMSNDRKIVGVVALDSLEGIPSELSPDNAQEFILLSEQ
jgi:hypothetical protein